MTTTGRGIPRALDIGTVGNTVTAGDTFPASVTYYLLGRQDAGRPVIEPMLQHSDSWVRDKVRRALAKIDRAAAKKAAKPE